MKAHPWNAGGEHAVCGRCLRYGLCRAEIDVSWWDGACVEYLPHGHLAKRSPPAGKAGGL